MNWIEYAERKPSPEPKRKILLYFQEGGGGGGAFITDTFDAQLTHSATHWAEIEGPTNMKAEDPSEEWSRQLIGDREYKAMLKKESPPAPDPFEEWWRCEMINPLMSDDEGKHTAKLGWDAAIKWKEGKG